MFQGVHVMEVEWSRLKAHEVRNLAEKDAIVILPIAAIEQHGPHLPVMVDTRLVSEVARLSAIESNKTGNLAIILPTIWHGLSEHHMPFGGTVTLDTQTFHLVIRAVIESISRQGFRKFLILNGHGGNVSASEVIAQDITLELGIPIIAATYWLEAAERFKNILESQDNVLHACEAETSMMLLLEPDLVVFENLSDFKGAMDLSFLKAGNSAYRWRSLSHVTPNGVIGDPTLATPEKGARLLEAAALSVSELISDPETFSCQNDLRSDSVREN
jgi:creatinine amidohydrolase